MYALTTKTMKIIPRIGFLSMNMLMHHINIDEVARAKNVQTIGRCIVVPFGKIPIPVYKNKEMKNKDIVNFLIRGISKVIIPVKAMMNKIPVKIRPKSNINPYLAPILPKSLIDIFGLNRENQGCRYTLVRKAHQNAMEPATEKWKE